jgi:hypothetical protein
MEKARKITGILALLALCACASDRGTTTASTTTTTGATGTSETSAAKVDCSAVRCAACPTGQHPILKPPDCCRCVPD